MKSRSVWGAKHPGDWLSSGSFCLSGTTCYRAEQVGVESVAGQWTAKARAFRCIATPLQLQLTVVIQSLLLVALYIETILLLMAVLQEKADLLDWTKRRTIENQS